jgi:hypothetical protein
VGAFDPVSAAFTAAMVALVEGTAVALPTRMALRGELAEVLRAE